MVQQTVRLSVPAEPAFARTVRMMAANLAVVCGMSMDDVEDVRMAAEEGFVLCCATAPACCAVDFVLSSGEVRTTFALGDEDPAGGEGSDFAELLLDAVCDEHGISEDGTQLYLVNRVGDADGE